jgi:hypothetical protein
MSVENKTLVRRWFKDIWSKGNLALADQIVAPNYFLGNEVCGITL